MVELGVRALLYSTFSLVTLDSGPQKNKDAFGPSNGNVRTCAAIKEQDGSLVVSFDVDFEINIVFPRILLRILPTSKEKAEAQGSETCRKTVKKEVDKSMMNVIQAYQKTVTEKAI